MRLTRKQIEEGLKMMPMDALLLGAGNSKEKKLTASQIKFAQEIALGKTKAEAYRQSRPNGRKSKAKPETASKRGQELAKDGAIQAQIEAFKVALEAQKYTTPAALRALAIHKITEKALSEKTPPAQQLKALELLGKITEVALFTERREIVQTANSSEMKAKLLNSIRLALSKQGAETVEADPAEQLLAELRDSQQDDGNSSDYVDSDYVQMDPEPDQEAKDPQTHPKKQILETPPDPDPQKLALPDTSPLHSIPHTQSQAESVTPPSAVTPVTGENVEKSTTSVSTSSNPMLSKGEGA